MLILAIMVVCLLVFYQPTKERFYCASLYAVVCGTHSVFFWNENGYVYYFTAAGCSLIIAVLLCAFGPINKLAWRLIMISIASIVLNCAGWLLWYFYQEPTGYNVLSMALYLLTILALTAKEGGHEYQTGKWYNRFLLSFNKSHPVCHTLQEETRQ
jgi:hypothetical protein